jgi:hypothetical protein
LDPKLRIVALSDLPPMETRLTGGEWVAQLRASMAETLGKQGHHIEAENINPFEAEPCAVAVLIAAFDELDALHAEVRKTKAISVGALGELRTVVDALNKLLDTTAPAIHDQIDTLARRVEEIEERLPNPTFDPTADDDDYD